MNLRIFVLFSPLQLFESEVRVSRGLKGTLNWGINREKDCCSGTFLSKSAENQNIKADGGGVQGGDWVKELNLLSGSCLIIAF